MIWEIKCQKHLNLKTEIWITKKWGIIISLFLWRDLKFASFLILFYPLSRTLNKTYTILLLFVSNIPTISLYKIHYSPFMTIQFLFYVSLHGLKHFVNICFLIFLFPNLFLFLFLSPMSLYHWKSKQLKRNKNKNNFLHV